MIIRALLPLLALTVSSLLVAQNSLVLEVTLNKPKDGGTLRVVLCPDAASFDSEKGCILKQVKVEGPTASVQFTGLAEGTYAVKAFHDVNDNGKLDTNWMGIPKEPYGFSNDAMGSFGPPSFQQAGFPIGAGRNKAIFRMRG